MGTVTLDGDLAGVGYLRSADAQHVRYIQALDDILHDALHLEIQVRWADLPPSCAGYCSLSRRAIVLARWLFWCAPWCVRRVLLHELLHFLVGPGEELVLAQLKIRYADLAEPPDWGCW